MLRQKITDALKDAMRAQQAERVGAIRLIMAGLKAKDIEARPNGQADGIPDEQILTLLQNMIKQRRESIALYEQGKRPDLVAKEAAEIAVIESFLPQQLADAAARTVVAGLIAELGAAGHKDMGRVMAAAKAKLAGQYDMSKASALVKELLSA